MSRGTANTTRNSSPRCPPCIEIRAARPTRKDDYLGVAGPGLAFEGAKGRSIRTIPDGTSNTILVVEADPSRAVVWTQPEDWTFDPQQPLAGLGNAHPGGFLVGMADGAVQFIAKTIDAKVFKSLLTVAGGEAVRP